MASTFVSLSGLSLTKEDGFVSLFDGKSLNLNETDIVSITSNNSFEKIDLKQRNTYNKKVAFDTQK